MLSSKTSSKTRKSLPNLSYKSSTKTHTSLNKSKSSNRAKSKLTKKSKTQKSSELSNMIPSYDMIKLFKAYIIIVEDKYDKIITPKINTQLLSIIKQNKTKSKLPKNTKLLNPNNPLKLRHPKSSKSIAQNGGVLVQAQIQVIQDILDNITYEISYQDVISINDDVNFNRLLYLLDHNGFMPLYNVTRRGDTYIINNQFVLHKNDILNDQENVIVFIKRNISEAFYNERLQITIYMELLSVVLAMVCKNIIISDDDLGYKPLVIVDYMNVFMELFNNYRNNPRLHGLAVSQQDRMRFRNDVSNLIDSWYDKSYFHDKYIFMVNNEDERLFVIKNNHTLQIGLNWINSNNNIKLNIFDSDAGGVLTYNIYNPNEVIYNNSIDDNIMHVLNLLINQNYNGVYRNVYFISKDKFNEFRTNRNYIIEYIYINMSNRLEITIDEQNINRFYYTNLLRYIDNLPDHEY